MAAVRKETKERSFRRRGRIAWTLAAVMLLVGLAPLVLMAWRQVQFNRLSLATAQQENQQLVAETIAHEVDIRVDELRVQLLRVAQAASWAFDGDERRAAALRGTLNEAVDARVPYLSYRLFRSSGVRRVDAGDLPEELRPAFGAALADAVELLHERVRSDARTTVISGPMLAGAGRRAHLVVSAPLVTNGRLAGVFSGLVDLQYVWETVALRWGGQSVFAVDPRGVVFASNAPGLPRPGFEAGSSPLVSRFLTNVHAGRETIPFTETVDGEEREFLGSYEVTGEGWGIFIQAPTAEVYRPVEAMIESTWNTALLVLVLCVVASWFFARTLSHPIDRLARASMRFAEGDFSTRVSIRSHNEIGALAHTFNAMADEIEEQIRRLQRAARENHELFMGTIRAMAQAIDAKDPYTRGHSMRVNRYSVILAKELGLRGAQLREIHVSSLMHDVGKIGIHDKILQKPGKLTDEEFEVMKTHTVLGANIIAPIRQMKRIIPGLRWHHERMNGQGYPDGLRGDEIPLMARIIAVADTFDAITTHRPYQTAMSFEEALKVLARLKGVALDARIVDTFFAAYEKGLIRAEPDDDLFSAEAPEPQPAGVAP